MTWSSAALLRRVLGCSEGRSADRWQDYSLFGHQVWIKAASGSSLQLTRCAVPCCCKARLNAAGLACDPQSRQHFFECQAELVTVAEVSETVSVLVSVPRRRAILMRPAQRALTTFADHMRMTDP